MRHKFVQWPDEEAKKYFYDKPLKGPHDHFKNEFALYGRFCGYFRKVKEYQERNSKKVRDELYLQSLSAEDKRAMDTQKKKDDE